MYAILRKQTRYTAIKNLHEYPVSGDASSKAQPAFTPSAGNLWAAPGVTGR